MQQQYPDIPRVWGVDWAVPPAEGGTRWTSYEWALQTAERLGVEQISIVGATYQNLGNLDIAIGHAEAAHLYRLPHEYRLRGVRVTGVPVRGGGAARGVVIVAWANDDVLGRVEGQHPAAIAAVATWPNHIRAWISAYQPRRIGQERPGEEADFALPAPPRLAPRAAEAVNKAAAWVNAAHGGLHGEEREVFAGALVALRAGGVPIDEDALRSHLMGRGWDGGLISDVVVLARRVARGETPQHRRMRLG